MGSARVCALGPGVRSCGAVAPRGGRACPRSPADVTRNRSLSGRRAFRRVRSEGRLAGFGPITVYGVRASEGRAGRVGLSVNGRRLTAVERNRIRRRVRAACGRFELPEGFDFVIRAGAEAGDLDFQKLVSSLSKAFHRVATSRRPE
jgi:ribonuclease P protein component